jgi:uncharacterized protein YodC (DUF2158 family)
MEHDFKVGDPVQLKSGGPVMIIEEIGQREATGAGAKEEAKCVWFSGAVVKERLFDLRTLKAATEVDVHAVLLDIASMIRRDDR